MALVKYGGGIVQMSGSVAGNTYARNRFGNYMRARTKPINPKSSRQVAARIIMMYLAEQWRESPMTDAIRAAWATYADSVNWQNKLGEVVKLTGYQHFMRSNTAILALGGTLVTAGPPDLGLPPGDPAFVVNPPSAAGQNVDVDFDDTFDWCAEDDGYLSMYMGRPQNPTRNFFDGPWRRWISIDGDTAVPITSPQVGQVGMPYTVVLGQKIWYKARIIRADGRCSTEFECPPVIAVA